jgi:SOS-response transcriptional repressor LexA
MHKIQQKLLALSKKKNLAKMSLREMASDIEMPKESPQKIKHHLEQIVKKGFITIDRDNGEMNRVEAGVNPGLLETTTPVFSIPIIGTANCGPANLYAEENFQGYLRVSNKLVGKSKPTGLYAIKADGQSMNRAEVSGKKIEDGDFVIIDSTKKNPVTNDIVLAIIENRATIKRFIRDKANDQIVLMADSSFNYDPIYLHESDQFSISGKAISIIKKPKID